MTNVCIIPARGGSTRIPRKNIKPFLGTPMLVRAIQTARASGLFYEIYVSTEDSEIQRVAVEAGASIIDRPPELAVGEVGTQEVMQHAVKTLGLTGDVSVCCLYPCTPLLEIADLRSAHALDHSWAYTIAVSDTHGGDIGWFYFGWANSFRTAAALWKDRTRVYPIERERAIDINTDADWQAAEDAYRTMHRSAA